jgi:hypothetical protein
MSEMRESPKWGIPFFRVNITYSIYHKGFLWEINGLVIWGCASGAILF